MGTPRGDLGARRAQQAGAQPLPSACPRQQVARSAEGPSIAPTRAPAQLCPSRRGLGQVPALRPHRPRERRCRGGGGCMLRAHRASVADGKPEGAVTVWKNQTRNDRLRPRSHEKLKPGAASLDVGDLEGLATSGFGREAGGTRLVEELWAKAGKPSPGTASRANVGHTAGPSSPRPCPRPLS